MAFEVFYPVARYVLMKEKKNENNIISNNRRYAKMMTGTIPMLVIIVGAAIAYVQVYLLKVCIVRQLDESAC